jgi:hypothetical protein
MEKWQPRIIICFLSLNDWGAPRTKKKWQRHFVPMHTRKLSSHVGSLGSAQERFLALMNRELADRSQTQGNALNISWKRFHYPMPPHGDAFPGAAYHCQRNSVTKTSSSNILSNMDAGSVDTLGELLGLLDQYFEFQIDAIAMSNASWLFCLIELESICARPGEEVTPRLRTGFSIQKAMLTVCYMHAINCSRCAPKRQKCTQY